jgi:hypothetical protein
MGMNNLKNINRCRIPVFGGFRVDQPIIIFTDWKLGATDLALVPVDNHDGTSQ